MGAPQAEGMGGANYFHLSKLMAEDDIEVFLYAFETTAMVAKWPQAQWVTILGPYLICPPQIVLKTIMAQDVTTFERVKAVYLTVMR